MHLGQHPVKEIAFAQARFADQKTLGAKFLCSLMQDHHTGQNGEHAVGHGAKNALHFMDILTFQFFIHLADVAGIQFVLAFGHTIEFTAVPPMPHKATGSVGGSQSMAFNSF